MPNNSKNSINKNLKKETKRHIKNTPKKVNPNNTSTLKKQTHINENSIYEKNLSALSVRDPLLCYKLLNIKTNEKFEVFMGDDGANFNILDNEKNPFYLTNPLEENLKKYNDLAPYRYYPYLYFYGLGNGVLHSMLLENEVLKRIVVIEPELEIIYIVLNLIDLSEHILSNKLILLESSFCNQAMINSLFDIDKNSKVYSKLYDLLMPNSYYEKYAQDLIRINKNFIKAIEHSVVSIGNDSKDAIIGIQNHIQNLPFVLTHPSLINLHAKIKDRDSALIVSTGPSLYKQLDKLREMQDYVTIFCIDASFPILFQNGIKPDIVFSLERVKESARFYSDTPLQAQEGVVFALTSIVHEDTINAISNGQKSFSFRPFGYTNLFKLAEYGYLGIGMSAANMAYELVVHARFKRCIIIGQDLAFGDDGSSHSKGALYGENEISPKSDGEKIFVEKYGGGGMVETTEIWKIFLNFYEKDIANTPYKIEVINATEGGARIHGTIEMSFTEALNLVEKKKKDKITLDYPSPEYSKKHLLQSLQKCDEWIEYGDRERAKIEGLFLDLAGFLENIEGLNKEGNLKIESFGDMPSLIERLDKVKDDFNSPKSFNYFNDALQSYIFHQELDIAKLLVRPVENDDEKKAKELEWLYAHKYWLFSLAGGIDSVVHVVKEAKDVLVHNARSLGIEAP